MVMASLSYNWIISLLCVLPCFLVFLSRLYRKAGTPSAAPPSPWRLPIIGNLHQLILNPSLGFHSLPQKYGPLMLLHIGSLPLFLISSSDLAGEASTNFLQRPTNKAMRLLSPECDGLICSPYGHRWRQARKLCVNERLSLKRVQSFHYIREEEVAKLMEKINLNCLNSNIRCEINLSTLFTTLANNIVSRAVLGQMSSDDIDNNEVTASLANDAAQFVASFFFGDYFLAFSWFDNLTGLTRKGKENVQAIHSLLDRVIEEHEIRTGRGDAANQNDKKDFVDVILELKRNDTPGLQDPTSDQIKTILTDMFLAGTETNSATMEWTMAELMKNPQIMKKLQQEIRDAVGEKSQIHEADINQMKYLKLVIKETLRLHGPVVIGRKAPATVKIGGFEIPANATVFINSWAISKDPATWERPTEFIPERFLNSSSDYNGQDLKYFPFGLGKRICPGIQFALSEIEFGLASLLCWFDWELPGGISPEIFDMCGTSSLFPRKKLPLCLVPVPQAYGLSHYI